MTCYNCFQDCHNRFLSTFLKQNSLLISVKACAYFNIETLKSMSRKEMKLHGMKRENDKDMIVVNDSTENNDAFDWFNFDYGGKTRVEEFKNLGNTFHTLILQTNCLSFISCLCMRNSSSRSTKFCRHEDNSDYSVIKETQTAC